MAYTAPPLPSTIPLITSGKVRDLYSLSPSTLLFVASDRISAFDVVLSNGIPQKGVLLTQMTAHWMKVLSAAIPDLKTHLISLDLPQEITNEQSITQDIVKSLEGRSMVVGKYKIFAIEAIVRGYITGSAWSEYKKSGTMNGRKLREGLRESEKFDQPIYTPSTKAELGGKDENISIEQAAEIVGPKYAKKIEELALRLYETAHAYALERGIIIADTKFEFGIPIPDASSTSDEADGSQEVILVDEVLTPDSSRFWPRDKYKVGKSQESFDKQYLRDWLIGEGLKDKDGVSMPPEVVRKTGEKYREAFELLTGREF